VPCITLLYRDANGPCPALPLPLQAIRNHSDLTMHSLNHTIKQTCHYTALPQSALRQTCHYTTPLLSGNHTDPVNILVLPLSSHYRPSHHTALPKSRHHIDYTGTLLIRLSDFVIISHSPNQDIIQTLMHSTNQAIRWSP